jgi:hypothetical protein
MGKKQSCWHYDFKISRSQKRPCFQKSFWSAKTYCTYFNEGNAYDELKRVIFLAITSYIVFPEKSHYKSDHVSREEGRKEGAQETIKKLTMALLSKGYSVEEVSEITEMSLQKITSLVEQKNRQSLRTSEFR